MRGFKVAQTAVGLSLIAGLCAAVAPPVNAAESVLGAATAIKGSPSERFQSTPAGKPIPRPTGVAANASPEQIARAFLQGSQSGVRALAVSSDDLVVKDVQPSAADGNVVKFQQEVDGIPVVGGETMVDLDKDGNIRTASAESAMSPADLSPALTANAAEAVARAAVAKQEGVSAISLSVTPAQQWIYDSKIVGGPGSGEPTLTWRIEVTSATLGLVRRMVLVDANTGAISLSINGIEEAKNRSVCNANNSNGNSNSKYPCVSVDRSEGGSASVVADVNDAYTFAGQTYDFYSTMLGRDSIDGSGMPIKSTVKFCATSCPYANAFWNGSQMVYGLGFAHASDVVGHELTHGVTQHLSGLLYYYQSGALNEGLSDIFGEFIDRANSGDTSWNMGEDLGSPLRSMSDPPLHSDPDRTGSSLYYGGTSDGGGVHTNSGVANKFAYLITQAGSRTFNGHTVTGLSDGLGTSTSDSKPVHIIYEAAKLMTSAGDYASFAAALRSACSSLIGTITTSGDCTQVEQAIQATEMDSAPANALPAQATMCAAGTWASTIWADDLENPASGNWVKSTTGSTGWYYSSESMPYAGWSSEKPTSGTNNLWGDDASTSQIATVTQATGVNVPSGASYLRFNHAFAFEQGTNVSTQNYDGGVLEYSGNGGGWLNAATLINSDAENNGIRPGASVLATGTGNTLGGQAAFVGINSGFAMGSTRVPLASLAGQSVKFRFRVSTDNGTSDAGWFIDDVKYYSCVSTPGAPTSVSAVSASTQATVSWVGPGIVGGSAIDHYTVSASPGPQTCTTPNDATLSCVVTGLTNGVAYTFSVAAHNASGDGAASAASNPVVPAAPVPVQTTPATTPPTTPAATPATTPAAPPVATPAKICRIFAGRFMVGKRVFQARVKSCFLPPMTVAKRKAGKARAVKAARAKARNAARR